MFSLPKFCGPSKFPKPVRPHLKFPLLDYYEFSLSQVFTEFVTFNLLLRLPTTNFCANYDQHSPHLSPSFFKLCFLRQFFLLSRLENLYGWRCPWKIWIPLFPFFYVPQKLTDQPKKSRYSWKIGGPFTRCHWLPCFLWFFQPCHIPVFCGSVFLLFMAVPISEFSMHFLALAQPLLPLHWNYCMRSYSI